jgi:hypothetical protein
VGHPSAVEEFSWPEVTSSKLFEVFSLSGLSFEDLLIDEQRIVLRSLMDGERIRKFGASAGFAAYELLLCMATRMKTHTDTAGHQHNHRDSYDNMLGRGQI